MGNNSHILDFSSKTTTSVKRREARPLPVLVEQARELCIIELDKNLAKMFEQADDYLFDMSESGYNNSHFDAMRMLRLKKDGLLRQFQQELKVSFSDNLGKISPSDSAFGEESAEMSFENIALVKDDDLEEGIAIDGIVKKARNENLEEIEQIRIRLDTLISDKSITQENNPFEPAFICSAFKKASLALDIDIESMLVIYKLFERMVMSRLADTYITVNQFFVDKGVLPELKHSARVARNVTKPTISATDTFADALQDIATSRENQESVDNHQQSNEQIISLIQDLLAQNRGGQAQKVQSTNLKERDSGSHQQIDTNQLVNALTRLQTSQVHTDLTQPQAPDLRHVIAAQLGTEQQMPKGALSQFNDDMIDIVSMLFDFILDDKNLHVEIKSIIARLQIPMLKVGLVDRSFFSNRKHPARILLNEIARAGISWDPNDVDAAGMLQKIESICEEIITNFNDDVAIFDYLLKDFEEYRIKVQRRSDIFERRTKESEEGKARAESARGIVNRTVEKICKGQQVPDSIKALLKNVWVHVMFLEKLKDSEDGWEKSVKLAQLLIWSAQPVTTSMGLEKLITRIPLLVKNLRKGFGMVSLSPIEATHLLDQLEITHRSIIKSAQEQIEHGDKEEILRLEPVALMPSMLSSDKLSSESSKGNSSNKNDSDETNNQPIAAPIKIQDIGFSAEQVGRKNTLSQQQSLEIKQESLQLVESLRAGVWVELIKDKQPIRCKLAAKITSTGKFIFVNRSGVKMAEFFTKELAAAYQLGNIKILDDEALFDRALESVISNLRAMKADS